MVKFNSNKDKVYVMRCAIWHYLHSFKKVKNTDGGVLLLVKLHGRFSCFLKCTNGGTIASRNASLMEMFCKRFQENQMFPWFLKTLHATTF